jgi:hypothetical protein
MDGHDAGAVARHGPRAGRPGADPFRALEAFRHDDRANFAEELADVLIRLVGLAHGLGIDLGAETWAKVEANKARPFQHGGKRL